MTGRNHRNKQAIEDFSKLISLKSNEVHFYVERGSAYFYDSQRENAIGDFKKATGLDPNLIARFKKACETGYEQRCEILRMISERQ